MSTNEQQVSSRLSGSVHPRDEESGENSSPETRRPRQLLTDGEAAEYEHPQVLSFAARNRRGRFYIPSKDNAFGGMRVENVLFDSGCSSLLLPFPVDAGFPAQLTTPSVYEWIVSASRGTGAVHSPVLKIKKRIGQFACTLAGKVQPSLHMLRFHLGSQAANVLLNNRNLRQMLDDNCVTKLIDFLGKLSGSTSPERTYALLGQSYLSHVILCQGSDVALAIHQDFDGSDNIVHIMGNYHRKLVPLVRAFAGFHDLEDDDGDEDEEDFRVSFDVPSSDDEIDEPDR